MAELIPDPSKGIRFHWTDLDGNRWITQNGGPRQSHQTTAIAHRVVQMLDGPDGMKTQRGRDLFTMVRAIATEELLREISTKEDSN